MASNIPLLVQQAEGLVRKGANISYLSEVSAEAKAVVGMMIPLANKINACKTWIDRHIEPEVQSRRAAATSRNRPGGPVRLDQ